MKGGKRMTIKKISQKLKFDVEAQDCCPDGWFRFSENCSNDCEKVTWSGANAFKVLQGGDWRVLCTKETTYSCATSHLL